MADLAGGFVMQDVWPTSQAQKHLAQVIYDGWVTLM
jgi:hypothetical protein